MSDKSYKRQGDQDPIPVVGDTERIEDGIDTKTADSDAQLERDDNEAIDESNIIDDRTRGAKPSGGYTEKEEEDIPEGDA